MLLDDGTRHRTVSAEKDRLSVVAFRPEIWYAASASMKGRLKATGFGLEDPKAWVPPTRMAFVPQAIGRMGVEYIGRGASHLTLPGSKWANPFNIKGEVTREVALQKFEKYLEHTPELRADLPSLEGKILMCHCKEGQGCHGDILIREFGKFKLEQEHRQEKAPPSDQAVRDVAEWRKGIASKNLIPRKAPCPSQATQ